ncbi:uncharacterized protein LOC119840538 [Zerene cesonia]|uniref:uncharacterized protein LOC119840538 n=1 Tax=Zerene cesonia TaxID=33412 RepID=UPI0018E56B62|nr:uncharacterized protein LOC119840538 [Zerene cesonia]
MAGQLTRFIYLQYFTTLVLYGSVDGSLSIDENTLSPECRALGICTEVPDYPDAIASKLIKELKNNKTVFSNDIPFSTSRQGFTTMDTDLCDSKQTLYVPKAAKNKDNQWYYILNTQKEIVQRFLVEICRQNNKRSMMLGNKDDSRCSSLASFSKNTEGICVQKHILREMIGISKSGEIFIEHFNIPCCCECVERSLTTNDL